MRIREVTKLIEKTAPLKLAEKWDDVGMIVGNKNKNFNNCLIVLDCTNEVVDYAIKNNIDLIIAHHPLFEGVHASNLVKQKLEKNQINFYVAHTNFDKIKNNMSKLIANKLNFKIIKSSFDGFGVICTTNLSSRAVAKKAIKEFNLESVNITGTKKINKVAVISGSGKSFWNQAQNEGCNYMVTGDVTHHDGLDAVQNDFYFIDIKHKAEDVFIELMMNLLKNKITGIHTIKNEDIFINVK